MASRNNIRVFLDTNVLFSAFYAPNGAPGIILEKFIGGEINVVVSRQVLEELLRNLKRKYPQALPILQKMMINSPPEIQTDTSVEEIDKLKTGLAIGDSDILATAISARVDYFITGDHDFLDNPAIIREYGLKIVSPAEFLRLMRTR